MGKISDHSCILQHSMARIKRRANERQTDPYSLTWTGKSDGEASMGIIKSQLRFVSIHKALSDIGITRYAAHHCHA
jgi:hypothetical protein